MAMIQCPECGQNVSDKAGRCPHCGNPELGSYIATQSILARMRTTLTPASGLIGISLPSAGGGYGYYMDNPGASSKYTVSAVVQHRGLFGGVSSRLTQLRDELGRLTFTGGYHVFEIGQASTIRVTFPRGLGDIPLYFDFEAEPGHLYEIYFFEPATGMEHDSVDATPRKNGRGGTDYSSGLSLEARIRMIF